MKIGSIKEWILVILPLVVFWGLSRLIYLNPPFFEEIFELKVTNAMYIVVFLVFIPGVVAYFTEKYLRQILSGNDDSKFKF